MITWLSNYPLIPIVFGTLFLAGGGLLATWGWNAWSSAQIRSTLQETEQARILQQRTAMLQTLGAEYRANSSVLQHSAYSQPTTDRGSLVIFPPFHADALRAAISSGLFAGPADRELFWAIVNLQQAIEAFHKTADFILSGMMMTATPGRPVSKEGSKQSRGGMHRALLESESMRKLRNQFRILRDVLEAHGIDTTNAPPQ